MSGSWRNSLYTPTMIQKIDNNYFIVDCWHHRIIYNDNLRDKISAWKTLTEDINGGHTLACDGEFYFCDDTDSGQIKIFSKSESGGVSFCRQFRRSYRQTALHKIRRPHKKHLHSFVHGGVHAEVTKSRQ